jgi:hypothetical protein
METYGVFCCCTAPLHCIAHPLFLCMVAGLVPCVTCPLLCCLREKPLDTGFHLESPRTVCARNVTHIFLPTLLFPYTCFRLCVLNPCGKGEGNLTA